MSYHERILDREAARMEQALARKVHHEPVEAVPIVSSGASSGAVTFAATFAEEYKKEDGWTFSRTKPKHDYTPPHRRRPR